MQIHTRRIAWLVTSMGYGDSLLYWEPILREYIARFPNTKVFTSGEKILSQSDAAIDVVDAVRVHRFFVKPQQNTYQKNILFISPSVILPLHRYNPELIILSEFGLLTIYGLLYRLLRPHTRVLLLVESDPHQLAGNISRGVRRLFRKLICKAATHILTNNNAGRKYLTDEIGVADSKLTSKPYLVSSVSADLSTGAIDEVGTIDHLPSQYVAFLYVGQISRRKGVFDLLDALLAIPPDLRDRCRLWVVGKGDCYEEFRQSVLDRGLSEYVSIFGGQPYVLLGHFYRCADVLVFPTRHDYRALVGFEALKFGLPLIHSRGDGAVCEVVEEGANGFSFEPGDATAIAAHMAYFIDNIDKIIIFGDRSRKLATQFTVGKSADVLASASCRALGIPE